MKSLRSASLGVYVVAVVEQGDYATIAKLTESGMWSGVDNEDAAVLELISASKLHDVHCRRSMNAALHGCATRGCSRAKVMFRGLAFSVVIGRLFEDGHVSFDIATRLVRMGALTKKLPPSLPPPSLPPSCSPSHCIPPAPAGPSPLLLCCTSSICPCCTHPCLLLLSPLP